MAADDPLDFAPKLGWQPGPEDPRTLRLSAYTTPELAPAPSTVDWMSKVKKWPMLGNDRMGNCVLVSCAHLVQGWTGHAAGTEILIPERDVVTAYSKITGFNPRTGANDRGTRSLDAMNYWRKNGIGGRRIAAFVKLDHRDRNELCTALHLFGGVFIAADLPTAADGQMRARKVWTPTRGSAGRRGSWGGHAMHMGGYDADGIVVSTWGRVQRATWSWWDTYGAEAWGVVSTDWLATEGGVSPLGFDLAAMQADLRRVTS